MSMPTGSRCILWMRFYSSEFYFGEDFISIIRKFLRVWEFKWKPLTGTFNSPNSEVEERTRIREISGVYVFGLSRKLATWMERSQGQTGNMHEPWNRIGGKQSSAEKNRVRKTWQRCGLPSPLLERNKGLVWKGKLTIKRLWGCVIGYLEVQMWGLTQRRIHLKEQLCSGGNQLNVLNYFSCNFHFLSELGCRVCECPPCILMCF